MKKSLLKNNIKTIIKSRRRFFSILVMAFLGVGFYAGLVATSPDMENSLDTYLDNSNMYDINVISTLGLTDEDVQAIKEIDGVKEAYPGISKDSNSLFNEKESVCKVIEYDENVNTPVVIAGRLPQTKDECLLDENYALNQNASDYIGKEITLLNDDKKEDTDEDVFKEKKFKVVGVVTSPIYISNTRGNTTLGNGTVAYYIYVNKSVINTDYYTEINVILDGTKENVTGNVQYNQKVQEVKTSIQSIKEERENARYLSIVDKANKKLAEAEDEYEKNKKEAEDSLNDASKKITNAKEELSTNEEKIKSAESKLLREEKNANSEFLNYENKLKEGRETLATKEKELEDGSSKFEEEKKNYNLTLTEINNNLNNLNLNLDALKKQKTLLEAAGEDTSQIDTNILNLTQKIEELNSNKIRIEEGLKQAETNISSGKIELENAKNELERNQKELESKRKEALNKFSTAKAEINNSKQRIEDAKLKLEQNEKEFETKRNEVNLKLEDAKAKLNEAKDKIKQIEKAKWYILTREDNSGYTNIFDAIKTMNNIATLFPVIFYFVAVLISLTSMTRMIEEERIEIGTLKSLGYTNTQIIYKYIMYSFLACVIGGVLGMSVGFYVLPTIVWSLYSLLYTIPHFYISYKFGIGITGIAIAFLCIGGATLIVAIKELKNSPATLMRPKPPKNGKRILLERIGFIWNKISFSNKVTIRNIFRYKKRAMMTIIGIAGCTGLMLTGFGIKNSVEDIPQMQFGNVFKYDASISLLNQNNINDIEKYVSESEKIEALNKVCASTGSLKKGSKTVNVNVFVPENNDTFDNVCNLEDVETNKKILLSNDGIVITDKAAESLNINKGDTITLVGSDDIEYELKVVAIAKNYVSHYVYMSKEFYESNIKSYSTNMIFLNMENIQNEEELKITEDLLNIEGVASVSLTSTLMKTISDMLNTMNYVVVVLIVSSALLAFVVLYNLANINIAERKREIATLKVLGFYENEVDSYINKENVIFTILGIIFGLVFGYFLTDAIVASVEIDSLRFLRHIKELSYIYSAIITCIFSFIVNFIIHFVLQKIDMIESLKSVE